MIPMEVCHIIFVGKNKKFKPVLHVEKKNIILIQLRNNLLGIWNNISLILKPNNNI